MAVPTKPQKVTSYGNDRVWLVDAIANVNASTAAAINAGEYLACYLLSDQEFLTATINKVSLPNLLCETDTYQALGSREWDHADLVGVYDPQAAPGSAGKVAYDLIKDGDPYVGFIVVGGGIDADADDQAAAGERVNIAPCEIRLTTPLRKTSNDASGIYVFGAAVAITGEPGLDVALT